MMIKTFIIILAFLASSTIAQLSQSVSDDSQVDALGNKFLQREAYDDTEIAKRPIDEFSDDSCPQDLAVRWHTEVGSSIYATPLITDLFSDGRKDIILPGFRRSLHVLDGRTGGIDTAFEAAHVSSLHTTPLLFDADFDGVQDILVATYDGYVQFFKDTGADASHRLMVPRLRVKRDWFQGLKADPTDHSKPDVGADKDDSGIGERGMRRKSTGGSGSVNGVNVGAGDRTVKENNNAGVRTGQRSLLMDVGRAEESTQTVTQPHELSEEGSETFEELFGENEQEEEEEDEEEGEDAKKGHGAGEKWLDEDLAEELEEEEDDYEALRHKEEDPANWEMDYDEDEENHEHDYEIKSKLWEDDIHTAPKHKKDEYSSPYVWVDSHILANPVIGDIDGDGREELVLAVSYFFDPGQYAADSHRAALAVGPNGDPAKYVASGVVVFDLHTRGIKWSQHLDLSTRYTRYKALAYSAPTLADVNGDGLLEVLVGTSMGFVYVLDPKTGATLDGWPVQMGDVQGQVAVGDVNGDDQIEIIAADTRGSIAVLRSDGKELWERHLGSAVGAGATLGDVDGDGQLEIVIGTFDGRIFVLDGRTGADKPGFPFRTFGRIAAPVLLTKLDDPRRRGLQLAATSHDGFLYVIDGRTACADSVDLGEASYSMVLADDLASSGHLDLLVATAGGNVYALRTAALYQPLKAWPAQVPGIGSAGFSARWEWEGVYATAATRIPRDVRGEALPVRFTIIDRRPSLNTNNNNNNGGVKGKGGTRGPYRVSVSLLGVGAKEMNSGDQPIIGMSQIVNTTGTYTIDVPCPRTRTSATVRVEMRDESGAVFYDEFALSFHIHFYRLLKWLVVGPFAFTAVAMLAFNGAAAVRAQLPS